MNIEKFEDYWLGGAGVYTTKAEAVAASDDYETCWAYADSRDARAWID